MKRLVVLGAAVVLVLLPVGSALAQYPPAAPSLTVSDTVVSPGETITVSGRDWLPGSTVSISLLPGVGVLGTAEVGAEGTFASQVTIPGDTAPGTYTLRASGTGENGQQRTVDATITVPGAPAAGQLAVTGGAVTVWMMVAASLILAGTAALLNARRRKATGT